MSATTDDGFIVESRARGSEASPRSGALTFIVLALDEAEALQIVAADHPELDHVVAASGRDIRAQAARLGLEPGTYRQT